MGSADSLPVQPYRRDQLTLKIGPAARALLPPANPWPGLSTGCWGALIIAVGPSGEKQLGQTRSSASLWREAGKEGLTWVETPLEEKGAVWREPALS